MAKIYFGPHTAAELRANGLWNSEEMTPDKAEATMSQASSMNPAVDTANIVIAQRQPQVKSPSTVPETDYAIERVSAASRYDRRVSARVRP